MCTNDKPALGATDRDTTLAIAQSVVKILAGHVRNIPACREPSSVDDVILEISEPLYDAVRVYRDRRHAADLLAMADRQGEEDLVGEVIRLLRSMPKDALPEPVRWQKAVYLAVGQNPPKDVGGPEEETK